MTLYLLDTSVLVDLQHRLAPTMAFVANSYAAGDGLASCLITVAEYRTGAPRGENEGMDAFLDSLAPLGMDLRTGESAAEYRFRYARRGIQIALSDALIAATARAHGASIVTENRKDFPMNDVPVLSLRS